MAKTLCLISYDIENNKARTKLANILLNYGQRIQYSVFEAYLEPKALGSLLDEVKEFVDPETDSLRVYPICKRCDDRVIVMGNKLAHDDLLDEIVVL